MNNLHEQLRQAMNGLRNIQTEQRVSIRRQNEKNKLVEAT